MKIFNWVHRRFHHKYEEQDATKAAEVTENGKDKLALLNDNNEPPLDHSVFDGWKEGILAIGTFGFDPALSKDIEQEEAYVCDNATRDEVSTDEDEEEDMEHPLVLKACKHGFFDDHKKDDHHYKYLPQCDEISQLNDHDEDGVVEDTDDLMMMMKYQKKAAGERITLADLFLADSQKIALLNNKLQHLADDEDRVKAKVDKNLLADESINVKHDLNDDRVTLISNKKLTKDHAARPIKKINRMVRKMLKKKIHPDVENQKQETARTKPKRL
uniref:protein TILLER ANGLE CONTROL 1 n=1 Tax=Erigeron canadensis TaxID=72917 RepID=UPI001CB96877|nr:protein TILLER ANGLE CONTROL 1 [Erigeron canadensis]